MTNTDPTADGLPSPSGPSPLGAAIPAPLVEDSTQVGADRHLAVQQTPAAPPQWSTPAPEHPAGRGRVETNPWPGPAPAAGQTFTSPWAPAQPSQHPWTSAEPPTQPWAAGAPTATYPAYSPAPKTPRKRVVVVAVAAVILVAVALAAAAAFGVQTVAGDYLAKVEKQTAIEDGVKRVREEAALPAAVDSVTTWDKVDAESDAVHFFYTVDRSVDSSSIAVADIRRLIMPNACTLSAAKSVLDADITLRLSYTFEDTGATRSIDITKGDCISGGF